jgi:hypothetical protein
MMPFYLGEDNIRTWNELIELKLNWVVTGCEYVSVLKAVHSSNIKS